MEPFGDVFHTSLLTVAAFLEAYFLHDFLESFLEALGDFWVPFGYHFDAFWGSVGAVKMVLPLVRELNFEVLGSFFCFFFAGWFCSGVWNRFFDVFLRFRGPLGMPLGALWERLASLWASRC